MGLIKTPNEVSDQEWDSLFTKFDQKFGKFQETERSKKLVRASTPLQDGLRADSKKDSISGRVDINCPLYVVSGKTAIMPFDGIYPECSILTYNTSIPRAVCVADPHKCHVGSNCLGALLNRLGHLCQHFSRVQVYILHWRTPKSLLTKGIRASIMALVVRASTSTMRLTTLNPHSLNYFVTANSEQYEVRF